MKRKSKPVDSPAYAHVRNIYHHANSGKGLSWRILNGALGHALANAIAAHLRFDVDDFKRLHADFRGGYWMGAGDGSHLGESFYTRAVEGGHDSAARSFESWAGRPPVRWSEEVKTPGRLHVGREFTWQGQAVKVTSMREESLVACAYGQYIRDGKWEVGHLVYLDVRRRLEASVKQPDDTWILRVSAPVNLPDRKIRQRFTIPYTEIESARRAAESKRRAYEKELAEAETLESVTAIAGRASAEGEGAFRHFDIDLLQKAATAASGRILKSMSAEEKRQYQEKRGAQRARAQAEALQRWLAGEDVREWFAGPVRLRVKDNRVETSTQQSATLEGVRQVLPLILRLRHKSGPVEDVQLDLNEVKHAGKEGVQVGCTLVPWPEIEALARQLGIAVKPSAA
jgi:hypothetical protein